MRRLPAGADPHVTGRPRRGSSGALARRDAARKHHSYERRSPAARCRGASSFHVPSGAARTTGHRNRTPEPHDMTAGHSREEMRNGRGSTPPHARRRVATGLAALDTTEFSEFFNPASTARGRCAGTAGASSSASYGRSWRARSPRPGRRSARGAGRARRRESSGGAVHNDLSRLSILAARRSVATRALARPNASPGRLRPFISSRQTDHARLHGLSAGRPRCADRARYTPHTRLAPRGKPMHY